MKQVLPIILALLLSSSTTNASSITHRHRSYLEHQGILDRAAKKIKKEEDMKRQQIQEQARMVVAADHMERENANYQKNYQKAALQASKIIMTTTDNELQGLQTSLIPATPVVKPVPPKPVVKQAPMSFTQVISQPQEPTITTSSLQRMKAKMNAKLDQHSKLPEPETPKLQPIQSLAVVAPPKKAPVEALNQVEQPAAANDDLTVGTLLSQYQNQKQSEKEALAREQQAKMAKEDEKEQSDFEKQVMYGSEGKNQQKMQSIVQVESGESASSNSQESSSQQNKEAATPEPLEENPISQMMAQKHPEMAKSVEDATIEYMAQSHNSEPNRHGVLM